MLCLQKPKSLSLPRRCVHWRGDPFPKRTESAFAPACTSYCQNQEEISAKKIPPQRPPDTRKHTVLPVSIRLKSTEKTPACVSMWAFLQPISARIYFGKTASHRKRARLVQSRGASPQAYWMSVKAAQRRGCAKRAFCGVCFLMPGGLNEVGFWWRLLDSNQ